MTANYELYKNTMNVIEQKIKLANDAFSGKNGNYYVIPRYVPQKKVLSFKVKNLSDNSSFTILQKFGKCYGIKCYDPNGEKIYQFYQEIVDNKKLTHLLYDSTKKIGIEEISERIPGTNEFKPVKITENFLSDNGSVIDFTCESYNNPMIIPEHHTGFFLNSKTVPVNLYSPDIIKDKTIEFVAFYYLLNSDIVKNNMLEFNKTLKTFFNKQKESQSNSTPGNMTFPEDR